MTRKIFNIDTCSFDEIPGDSPHEAAHLLLKEIREHLEMGYSVECEIDVDKVVKMAEWMFWLGYDFVAEGHKFPHEEAANEIPR
jgi:hypothetical protein